MEVADEVHLILGELLSAEAVGCADRGMLTDLIRAANGLKLGLGQLALSQVSSLRLLDLTLVCMSPRNALDLVERVLKILLALRINVVAYLSEVARLHARIVYLYEGVPLHLLDSLLRRGVLLDDDRVVGDLAVEGSAFFDRRLLGAESLKDVSVLVF